VSAGVVSFAIIFVDKAVWPHGGTMDEAAKSSAGGSVRRPPTDHIAVPEY
jgi:hypothetical protein